MGKKSAVQATAQPARKSSKYVQAFRDRLEINGGGVLYSAVSGDTLAAINTIMSHRVCNKRDAVEFALQRMAREITRKR